MLDIKSLTSTIINIPAGRFFRLKYISEMPVKASIKKEGIKVIKLVTITARTGINYTHIKSVAPTFYDNVQIKESSWQWVIRNRIKHNSNTDKNYLVIAPTKIGNHAKTQYLLSTKEGFSLVTKEDILDYIIDSYWRKDPNRPVNYIALENIISIN